MTVAGFNTKGRSRFAKYHEDRTSDPEPSTKKSRVTDKPSSQKAPKLWKAGILVTGVSATLSGLAR